MDFGSALRAVDTGTLIREGGFAAGLAIVFIAFLIMAFILWNTFKHMQKTQETMFQKLQGLEGAIDENTQIEREILQRLAKIDGVLAVMGMLFHRTPMIDWGEGEARHDRCDCKEERREE